jgi:hypothetical protein
VGFVPGDEAGSGLTVLFVFLRAPRGSARPRKAVKWSIERRMCTPSGPAGRLVAWESRGLSPAEGRRHGMASTRDPPAEILRF